jgi:hypothetical protein
MKEIKDIIIVGGGTAGLTTALTFKKYFPNYNIKIVKSPKIEIVGVGEGSTEHWKEFMDLVGIDHIELINETDATIKIGILFNDWNHIGSSYSHSILNDFPSSIFNSLDIYNFEVIQNSSNPYILSKFFKEIYHQNKVNITPQLDVSNQFHFDTFKLNQFLTKKCTERNIDIITLHIDKVNLNSKGDIESLTSSQDISLKGDFFIDCSGFKKLLSSKLGTQWVSYKDYLPMDSAITYPTELNLTKGIEPYTKATALSHGWTWKIPTQSRYGNGYVFSSQYTDADNALNELNQHLGKNIEKASKIIKFETGRVNEFWNKNCVSIGLSSSFSEPLEAQSIGFSLIQAQLLCNSLNSWIYNPSVSKVYNNTINNIFDNVIDYVQIHYLTKRKDSKFWKEKPFKLTEFNKNTKERFSHGVFNNLDFNNNSMFKSLNFYQVYYGLGLITPQNIKHSLNNLPYLHLKEAEQEYNSYKSQTIPTSISHIDYLKLIKENYSF